MTTQLVNDAKNHSLETTSPNPLTGVYSTLVVTAKRFFPDPISFEAD